MDISFAENYQALATASIVAEIPLLRDSSSPPPDTIPPSLARQLLTVASALALDEVPEARRQAFEIASRLLVVAGSQGDIAAGCRVVLARLGNFPGADFVEPRVPSEAAVPAYLQLEEVGRRIENTVTAGGHHKVVLTDFQRKVFRALRKYDGVSFSAPTSSGKSFVLGLDLARRIKDAHEVVAYLVPTRALIRQVITQVRAELDRNQLDVPIRSIPVPLRPGQAKNGAVFVLTQERLLTLLHSQEGHQRFDTLYVDEAHTISDDARGIVLQTAIEAALRKFPSLRTCFGSPFVSNPRFFMDEFVPQQNSVWIVDSLSPVTQNQILVKAVRGQPGLADLALLEGGQEYALGRYKTGFTPKEKLTTVRAKMAALVTKRGECTLVYVNGPAEAEETADLLAEQSQSWEPHEDVKEAAQFLRDHVHPRYPLAKTLERGAAAHYGRMPSLVRGLVEDLFSQRKLRYVACTSTLLHGVDLPAKHMIIHHARKGRGNELTRLDFKNLAGRAGRLKKELHGFVWIVRPEVPTLAAIKDTTELPVDSSLNIVLKDGARFLQAAMAHALPSDERDIANAMLGKLFVDHKGGKPIHELAEKVPVADRPALRLALNKVAEIETTLSLDLLRRNTTIDPRRLQALLLEIQSVSNPLDLIPLHPAVGGKAFYDRLAEIAERTQRTLEDDFSKTYRYTSVLAAQWISGIPLKVIIQRAIDHKEKKNPQKSQDVGRLIVSLLDTIEDKVRFRLVKNLRAYGDLLAEEFGRRGRPDLVARIPPLHLFLECGTYKKTQISLISLGLSRMTSHLLLDRLGLPAELDPEECVSRLRATPLSRVNLPRPVMDEVRKVVGRIT